MACMRDYAFRMNIMEEIFEIRSCIEILVNDLHNIYTTDSFNKELQEINIGGYAFFKRLNQSLS